MIRKTSLLLLVVTICLPQLVLAQLGRWANEDDDAFAAGVESGRFRPFIEGNYGLAQPKFDGLDGDFATLGTLELKLGFAARDSLRPVLSKLGERYVFGTYLAEDVGLGSLDEGEFGSKLTRFGFGNRLGYGWGRKLLGLEMYNQNSLNWTQIDPTNYDQISLDAQAVFDRYDSSLRFGQLFEAGLQVHVFGSLGVSAGVEGAVIFPRTVFWPWLGSAMIYSGAQGALEFFSEQIIKTSPVIGPLLHFALKTGVSYAYYLASKKDMNWPFDSETPLTTEALKLGATITF